MSITFINNPEGEIPPGCQGTIGARQMVKAYLKSRRSRLKTEDGKVLRGLLVSREDLKALYEDENAEQFMLLFSASYNDTVNPPPFYEKPNLTAILAGVDKNGKLIMNNLKNKFSPCPDNCNLTNYADEFERTLPNC